MPLTNSEKVKRYQQRKAAAGFRVIHKWFPAEGYEEMCKAIDRVAQKIVDGRRGARKPRSKGDAD